MLGMSGIGVYLENLVPKLLRELRDYQFRLIGDEKKITALSLPSDGRVSVCSCHAPIYSIQEQILVCRAARGTSLLWVPHYNIPLFSSVPLLVTVHDVAHLVLPEVTKSLIRRTYARILFEGVRRKAKKILTVSQFTADEFLRCVGKPHGALEVVPNGVDAAWFESATSGEEPAQKDSTPYFIAVGNLKAHKRIDVLCRAFAAVKGDIPYKLLLVGKYDGFISGGQSMSELMALAPERIEATGSIEGSKLRALVRGASALVFPSSYEGFGLPPLEAMAAGVPVIAADIPPVREVCGEEAAYFPVDDQEALQGLLVHAEERVTEAQLQQGVAHARQFQWSNAAQAIARTMRSF